MLVLASAADTVTPSYEAGETGKWAAPAVGFAVTEVVDRDPEFGCTRGKLKVARKDADDGVGVVVEE